MTNAQTINRWIVAHGTLGRPERNWFPWLTWQGLVEGKSVVVPRLPTPGGQSFESWSNAFDQQIGAPIDNATALIGHSTGVPFLLRYLQRANQKVARVALVSGFAEPLDLSAYPEMQSLLRTFVDEDFNWSHLRTLCAQYICFHGDDDDVVPVEKGAAVARGLKVPLRLISGGKHLNTEAKRFDFVELRDALLRDH